MGRAEAHQNAVSVVPDVCAAGAQERVSWWASALLRELGPPYEMSRPTKIVPNRMALSLSHRLPGLLSQFLVGWAKRLEPLTVTDLRGRATSDTVAGRNAGATAHHHPASILHARASHPRRKTRSSMAQPHR